MRHFYNHSSFSILSIVSKIHSFPFNDPRYGRGFSSESLLLQGDDNSDEGERRRGGICTNAECATWHSTLMIRHSRKSAVLISCRSCLFGQFRFVHEKRRRTDETKGSHAEINRSVSCRDHGFAWNRCWNGNRCGIRLHAGGTDRNTCGFGERCFYGRSAGRA